MRSSSLSSSFDAIKELLADFAPKKDSEEIPKTLESYSLLNVTVASNFPKSPSTKALKFTQVKKSNVVTRKNEL